MIKTATAEEIHKALVPYLHRGHNHIDAIVEYAKDNGIEIESLASVIKNSVILKEKIKSDARTLNLVEQDDIDTLF